MLHQSPILAAAAALAAVCSSLALAGEPAPAARAQAEVPTFTRDVAPIVWEHCAVCHRPGEVAPFPLTSYAEVARRARQIALVTGSGFMPPWLPARGAHAFADERRLSPEQIETLRRWSEAGAPEGDPAQLAPLPRWPSGWRLGQPDLVVTFPERGTFRLPAEGPDEFRNLVVPVAPDGPRWVRAFELRPGETSAIHHAILQVDRSDSCRRLDARDPEPGFAGMGMGASTPPDGHFLGWTPGKEPRPAPHGTAWEIEPGDDLVLQLHLTPTGREQAVSARIGLTFADAPPERSLHSFLLFSEDIDLAPGARDVLVADETLLPVAVELLGLYPHAHYLAKSIVAKAILPDGRTDELLRIDEWNFDWQDEYRFLEPVALPGGTRLRMEWTFDNSADNVRNPNHPPARVRYGLESSDEMATLAFTLLPRTTRDLHELRAASARHTLSHRPDDPLVLNALGIALVDLERYDEAAAALERSVQLWRDSASAWAHLGLARLRLGQAKPAVQALEKALAIDPDHPLANVQLGRALLALGRPGKALNHYKQVLERRPELVDARVDWATLLALTGRTGSAIRQFELVLEARPGNADVHNNLANALAASDRRGEAVEHYRRAIELQPDHFDAHLNLARVLLDLERGAEALPQLREAARLRPGDEEVRALLERAQAR